jgi:predicted Zn-dependent protease
VCERLSKTKEAERYKARVIQFRENNPYHQYDLGLAAYEEGRYQESIAYYKKAVKIKSYEHNFYYAMAESYAQLGQSAQVISNLRLAEKYATDPSNKLRYSQKIELLKASLQPGQG